MSLQHDPDNPGIALAAEAAAALEPLQRRAIRELVADGLARRTTKAGASVAGFSLPDPNGRMFNSNSALAKGPLVVTFFRGGWCPWCAAELHELETVLPKIRERGAALVALSPQTAANSRRMQRDIGLNFLLLVDRGNKVAAAFGLRWELPAYMREQHTNAGADLPTWNGEDSWTLPMPGRFVIGRDRVVACAEVSADFMVRADPLDVLPTLDRLAQKHRI
jgi:peroxiredoxin